MRKPNPPPAAMPALAALLAGCLGAGPLRTPTDPGLRPPLATFQARASIPGTIPPGLDSAVARARRPMLGLVWGQVADTLYCQTSAVTARWPLTLEARITDLPDPMAMEKVGSGPGSRWGAGLPFLFDDGDGDGRLGPGPAATGPAPGRDWILGLAGASRVIYISDSTALAWLRAHPPADAFLAIADPGDLRPGFNFLAAVNPRDTLVVEYKAYGPAPGTFSIGYTRPDSGRYDSTAYRGLICDGFAVAPPGAPMPVELRAPGDSTFRLAWVARFFGPRAGP